MKGTLLHPNGMKGTLTPPERHEAHPHPTRTAWTAPSPITRVRVTFICCGIGR